MRYFYGLDGSCKPEGRAQKTAPRATFRARDPVLKSGMRLTDDLTDRRAIFAKGGLFLLLGLLASAGLLAQSPTLETAVLLAIALWAFCRWYYFMFYVVERYVDGTYRFAGLASFLRYLWKTRGARHP